MKTRTAATYAPLLLAASFTLVASPAHAQFQPRPVDDPALASATTSRGRWLVVPNADVDFEQPLGIIGSPSLDFKEDLARANQPVLLDR
jgi:hypothetical protein